MEKPVFYDPQRKRWKRLRRIFDVLALCGLVLGVIFVFGLLRMKPLPTLLLTPQTRNFRALTSPAKPVVKGTQKAQRSAHRKTSLAPSEITLNSGEGLRAAYYVDWDPASYASLKEHIKQIDLLFPDWLHVVTPDGSLTAYTAEDHRPYPVVDRAGAHGVDSENKVARAIALNRTDTEVYPEVNNYDPVRQTFYAGVADFLGSPQAQQRFQQQIDIFMAANPGYRGLVMDLQSIPGEHQADYQTLIAALYSDFQQHKHKLYVTAPVDDPDFNYGFMGAHSDGLLVMNYDEHQSAAEPGPVASQDWFVDNLRNILKVVPKEKIICSVGSYGYDWVLSEPPAAAPAKKGLKPLPAPPAKIVSSEMLSTQEAWQGASDSGSEVELDSDSLNPHYEYEDTDAHVRHEVWFLDAVTVLNEMRAAVHELGLQTFALWRLGSEDDSLWHIWDTPSKIDPAKTLNTVGPGYDIDNEGQGDIMRVTHRMQNGSRTVELDDDDSVPLPYRMVTAEHMLSYPLPYTVEYFGYHPRQVAFSFDDGPDPEWTPKILDVLKKYNVKGTFFMIGEEAQDNVGTMQRVYREGHEIGNHTFTHPDISEISATQVDLQLKLTERLFGSKLGVQPLYFRPPYSIDQEPDTNDQAAPVDRIQGLGYTVIGNKIDTNDWDEHPRKTPQEITDSVLQQLKDMEDAARQSRLGHPAA